MPPNPYRTRPMPERPGAPPSTLSELMAVGAFIWIVTVLRVALGHWRAERPSQELVFSWLVLLVVSLLGFRGLVRRRRAS